MLKAQIADLTTEVNVVKRAIGNGRVGDVDAPSRIGVPERAIMAPETQRNWITSYGTWSSTSEPLGQAQRMLWCRWQQCISPEMQNYGGARGMRTSRVGGARSTLGKISRESLRLSSCPRTLSTLRGRVLNDSNRPDRCIFMSSNSRR